MDTSRVWPVSATQTATTVGAVTAVLMLVVFAFGWKIAGWLIFSGSIFWGMKRVKNECGRSITCFRALNAGFQTAFFASIILAFVGYMVTKLGDL